MIWKARNNLEVTFTCRGFFLPSGRERMACTYIRNGRKQIDLWFVDGYYRADRDDHAMDLVELIADNGDSIHQWKTLGGTNE